tara:strand:+ start:804 stop:1115 length:312 start_codon:yes stop_codon:yes gene_type:complete
MKNNFFYLLIFFICLNFFSPLKSDEVFNIGKNIFVTSDCVTCHTLSNAGSKGQIGPNLDEIRPGKDRVIYAVTNGIGVMPAYPDLTADQIEAVAHYVSESVNN